MQLPQLTPSGAADDGSSIPPDCLKKALTAADFVTGHIVNKKNQGFSNAAEEQHILHFSKVLAEKYQRSDRFSQ
jgi:hypothetical protein